MIKLLRVFFPALILCTLICSGSFAQDVQHCGHEQYMQHLAATQPAVYKRIIELEKQLANQPANLRTTSLPDVTINIPVVVHVIHNNSSGTIGGTNNTNISDQQVQSQIDALNKDYQRLNADASQTPPGFQSVAANCKLVFCLATTDPSGNSTNGITRTYSSKATYTINDEVQLKGLSYWPSDQYLNIWTCDLRGIPSSQLLLGYAQKPGAASVPGLDPTDGEAATDGVVINYKAFGTIGTLYAKFNLGRTATHEIGHWLGLSHPWGDYNSGDCNLTDYCDDTPTCGNSYESSSPVCSDNAPITCSVPRMIQNYMEYSDDACMNLFTEDQKTRMRSAIELSARRSALLSSLGCCTVPALKTIPLVKNFEDGDLTSDDWTVINPNSSSSFTPGFELSAYSGYGKGSYSTAVPNDSVYVDADAATHKYMFTLESPYINIHNAHTPIVRFDWAYSPQAANGATDSVVVYISTGCANTWSVLKTFYGSSFSSTKNPRTDFTPAADEWSTTELNLGSYINKPAVRIKFVSYSKGFNTFYLDNINFGLISHTLAVNVYPNPVSSVVQVQTVFEGAKNVDYIVYNTLGQSVHQASDQQVYSSTKVLDLSFLASGVYFILVSDGDEKIVKRIVKQ